MGWNKLGRWVLLAGSVVLGVLAGVVGLWIFEAKVPAAMQTTVSTAEARVYYLGAGAGLGFVIYAWALLGVAIAGRSAASRTRRELAGK